MKSRVACTRPLQGNSKCCCSREQQPLARWVLGLFCHRSWPCVSVSTAGTGGAMAAPGRDQHPLAIAAWQSEQAKWSSCKELFSRCCYMGSPPPWQCALLWNSALPTPRAGCEEPGHEVGLRRSFKRWLTEWIPSTSIRRGSSVPAAFCSSIHHRSGFRWKI